MKKIVRIKAMAAKAERDAIRRAFQYVLVPELKLLQAQLSALDARMCALEAKLDAMIRRETLDLTLRKNGDHSEVVLVEEKRGLH
jgi:hypothetical protein